MDDGGKGKRRRGEEEVRANGVLTADAILISADF
jgi:hypothetical protein